MPGPLPGGTQPTLPGPETVDGAAPPQPSQVCASSKDGRRIDWRGLMRVILGW